MPSAALIGGATLGSALIGSNAANKAAKTQARGFAQARADAMPFMLPGQGAVGTLARWYGIDPTTGARTGQGIDHAAMLETLRNSPDYQFALEQGTNNVLNNYALRGQLKSGNTIKGLAEFNQGLATQQLGNVRGSLERLAQLGAGAAGMTGQAATGQGGALASGIIGAANAQTGALGSLGNYFMLQNLLGGNKGSIYGGQGTGGSLGGAGIQPPPGFGPGGIFASVPYGGF